MESRQRLGGEAVLEDNDPGLKRSIGYRVLKHAHFSVHTEMDVL